MYTQTQTRVLAHTQSWDQRILSDTWLGSIGKSWREKIWRLDQLTMLECYSNGMEVVLGMYKKGGGQAERMINPGY